MARVAGHGKRASFETSARRAPGPPQIYLPKGGGAVRGIDEKFAVNPATGTASLTIPIPVTHGRSGGHPDLVLTYDSGAGNGPFGLGWELRVPAISRKTDKGLPRYLDDEESDTFVMSGAEDLVPTLIEDDGSWRLDDVTRQLGPKTFAVRRYRPRIEGLFARIERWTNQADPSDVFWRSITRDNVTTTYGTTPECRIADPDDPTHIFRWLICDSFDDRGNALYYGYRPESSVGVDVGRPHERNRTDARRGANRYLKRIKYGNRKPHHPGEDLSQRTDWMMEVVLDYGEHYDEDAEGQPTFVTMRDDQRPWATRRDPFSSYRAGFEVRTYRLCRRILMFHHFPDELGVADCLVRSTELEYAEDPVVSVITGVTQSGYVRRDDGTYLKGSLPRLELSYSRAMLSSEVQEIDTESLENLPSGLDGTSYRWVDLDGEGISGILTEQAEGWFYKRNLGPLPVADEHGEERTGARFAPLEVVATRPLPGALASDRVQLMDLAGDGRVDLVQLDRPLAGYSERTAEGAWSDFTPFSSLPEVAWDDPNLRFVDLTGDGHADVLISEAEVFTWYPSLAEAGFDAAESVRRAADEEQGPRLVFADATQSVYLADLSGDGLTDLVRIRNGEVCYWPNLGYGRFGPKVTMDGAPWFDLPDLFSHDRIRLADIDGSGVADIIYLGRDDVSLYVNRSGNGWSGPERLTCLPLADDVAAVTVVDLLGTGTACLVWSSPLPGDAHRPMRYIDLMGGQKPHLLVGTANNLGAETQVHYAPSTKFYLADRAAGTPWITRLPFPVHVVERVETHDRISRNRLVTRYAYRHGYFDGDEREFRGFGLVEQWDTEEYAALSGSDVFADTVNLDPASHVPPVLTRTWFHTGASLEGEGLSRLFEREYYREGDPSLGESGLTDEQLGAMLLPDTVLPETEQHAGLEARGVRDACRSLKGALLRQEVYALDGSEVADRPYRASERNYTIKRLQPIGPNRHAVFFTHDRETVVSQYERKLYPVGDDLRADPRVSHTVNLDVDDWGNVLRSASVGYGRRLDDPEPPLTSEDRETQRGTLITYTQNEFTNPILEDDAHRAPLPFETRVYELHRVTPDADQPGVTNLFRIGEIAGKIAQAADGDHDLPYEDVDGAGAVEDRPHRRQIKRVRVRYRSDDLGGPLPLGELESMALPFDTYTLALTPGLIQELFVGTGKLTVAELDGVLAGEGGYVQVDGDGGWWAPAGQVFYSPDPNASPAEELAYARQHFFQPHRFVDPFGAITTVRYDAHHLLVLETEDPLHNKVSAGERDAADNLIGNGNDYRVLQPALVTDANRNRSAAAFDALGLVVGTAVMGKTGDGQGDSLAGFTPDLGRATVLDHLHDPLADPHSILRGATTRLVYDLFAYQRTMGDDEPQPPVISVVARETHASDLAPGEQSRVQHSLSYSDGFGRQIQHKVQAEPGPLEDGGTEVNPRWAVSGWTIFNNKGKPVRQFEPFFDDTHRFRFGHQVGVSSVLLYDPVERVVATLHPNHSWEKVVFDPWRQETWDVNDTVLEADPGADPHVGDLFRRLPDNDYLPTWYDARKNGQLGAAEQAAAAKTAVHGATPTVAYSDPLGRTILTVDHNRLPDPNHPIEERYATRIVLDIEGNHRAVVDANGRVVVRADFDLTGGRLHQRSMDAGDRWMLADAAGIRIRAWDSRGHAVRTVSDALRRPTHLYVQPEGGTEILTERTIYGEALPDAITRNLRGRTYRQYDGAGVLTSGAYDFKGNLLASDRRLAKECRARLDWSALDGLNGVDDLGTVAGPLLEPEAFESSTAYDALDRPRSLTTPDASIVLPHFNEANLLKSVFVRLRGSTEATPFVTNIDYDAKGRRTRIGYGNGASTTYNYDEETLRLVRLRTTRQAGDGPLQDLRYSYDPAGNLSAIRDDAQQTVFFANAVVSPSADFAYDALYRLVEADGREHIGQNANDLPAHRPELKPHYDFNDSTRRGLPHPNDGQAMRRYIERYTYDAVGNILAMVHQASNASWTRRYSYAADSNRLLATSLPGDPDDGPYSAAYGHDAHGNVTSMPHLAEIRWDFEDQMQRVDLGGGGVLYLVSDAAGRRVRKVHEHIGSTIEERIDLGGYEVYRKRNGSGLTLERQSLHVVDDTRLVALVETKTVDEGTAIGSPISVIRYQLGNHLGSASLELDAFGAVISYEEYHPYGTTSFQAGRSAVEASLKRYRYTGRERDDETGLYYQGARYYAPWLGRWTAPDPAGLNDGLDLYTYVSGNPTRRIDHSGLAGKKQGPEPELQLWFSEFTKAFSAEATATKKGRGFSDALRQWGKTLVKLWGGPRRHDLVHLEKPFVETPAGESQRVGVGERTANRKQAGAEREAAKTAQFKRTGNTDTSAPENVKYKQPPPPEIKPVSPKPLEVKGRSPSGAGGSDFANAPKPNPARSSAPKPTVTQGKGSPQLLLPFAQPKPTPKTPLVKGKGTVSVVTGIGVLMLGEDIAEAKTNDERAEIVVEAGEGMLLFSALAKSPLIGRFVPHVVVATTTWEATQRYVPRAVDAWASDEQKEWLANEVGKKIVGEHQTYSLEDTLGGAGRWIDKNLALPIGKYIVGD